MAVLHVLHVLGCDEDYRKVLTSILKHIQISRKLLLLILDSRRLGRL